MLFVDGSPRPEKERKSERGKPRESACYVRLHSTYAGIPKNTLFVWERTETIDSKPHYFVRNELYPDGVLLPVAICDVNLYDFRLREPLGNRPVDTWIVVFVVEEYDDEGNLICYKDCYDADGLLVHSEGFPSNAVGM